MFLKKETILSFNVWFSLKFGKCKSHYSRRRKIQKDFNFLDKLKTESKKAKLNLRLTDTPKKGVITPKTEDT